MMPPVDEMEFTSKVGGLIVKHKRKGIHLEIMIINDPSLIFLTS